jgi:AcrR family transcriptional regulator
MPTIEYVHGSGNRTRERILDAAEQLWGEKGVVGVSLREIRIAAGARNTAAVQFHFGNREGLIDALIERHMPAIGERQAELADAAPDDDTRALVEVLVRPVAEYLARGESQRSWVKVMAELAALPQLELGDMSALTPEAGVRAGTALFHQLEQEVPRAIAFERIISMADMSVHLCAVYARLIDSTDGRPRLPTDMFIENLVDMLHAALLAPATIRID